LRNIFYMLLLFGLLAVVTYASTLGQEFEFRMQQTETEEQALELVREYLPRMTEVGEWRSLQNYWMRLDRAACQEYFATHHQQEPDSPLFHYLWLRNSDDPQLQLNEARELIAKAPDFYWGYRIFSATYSQMLQNDDLALELQQDLLARQQGDIALLNQGLEHFRNDDYLLLALFHHYRRQGDYTRAEDHIIRLQDPAAMEANFSSVLEFIGQSQRVRSFEVLYPKMLSHAISQGKVARADSLTHYQNTFLYVLGQAQQWERMRGYFETYPELKQRDDTLSPRIDMNVKLGQYGTALSLLAEALDKEVLRIKEVETNDRFEPLKALPEWTLMIEHAWQAWEQNRQNRKAAALAKRRDKPAPGWELPDQEGNLVKLEDLKGSIVILDFWATWCNPCRKTMPLLDQWMKGESARDVLVFSVNIWENDPLQAARYMQDSGYAMTLLYGDNDLPKAYGFTGIPHICVLDKSGRITFEESGYNPDLPELLDFWVEELKK